MPCVIVHACMHAWLRSIVRARLPVLDLCCEPPASCNRPRAPPCLHV